MKPKYQEYYDFHWGPTKVDLTQIWIIVDALAGVKISRKRCTQILDKIEFVLEEAGIPVEIRWKESETIE